MVRGAKVVLTFDGACNQHSQIKQGPLATACSQLRDCFKRHRKHLGKEEGRIAGKQAGWVARRQGGRNGDGKEKRRKNRKREKNKRRLVISEKNYRDDCMEEVCCYSVPLP